MEDKNYTYPNNEENSIAAEFVNRYGVSSSVDDVMNYLHGIRITSEDKRSIGEMLIKEALREEAIVRMNEQYRLMKDMEIFAAYKDNWDGEGGYPLTEQVKRNFDVLLPNLSPKCLRRIQISPESNGTILIECTNQEAGVNLADNNYSFYIIQGNHVSGENNVPFDVDTLTEKLEELTW